MIKDLADCWHIIGTSGARDQYTESIVDVICILLWLVLNVKNVYGSMESILCDIDIWLRIGEQI